MTKQFPNPCCRCGFCCMSETCPTAIACFGIAKTDRCLAFEYNNETMTATCRLVHSGLIGEGTGCCMLARCFYCGIQYDFASLPDGMKKHIALSARKGN